MGAAPEVQNASLDARVLDALRQEIDVHADELDEQTVATIVDGVLDCDEPHTTASEEGARFVGFVDQITIRGVRSFGPAQSFGLSRGLTVVFGPNGVGKTSITDALELFEHAETSRNSIGGRETSDATHVPHFRTDGTQSPTPQVGLRISADHAGTVLKDESWSWGEGGHHSRVVPLTVIARRAIRRPFEAKAGERVELLGRAAGLDAVTSWSDAATALSRFSPALPSPAETAFHDLVVPLLDTVENDPSLRDVDELASYIQEEHDQPVPSALADLSGLPSVPPPPHEVDSGGLREAHTVLARCADRVASLPPSATGEVLEMFRHYLDVATVDDSCPACADGSLSRERAQHIRGILAGERDRVAAQEELDRARREAAAEARRVADRIDSWRPWTAAPSVPSPLEHTDLVAIWAEVERAADRWAQARLRAQEALADARRTPDSGDAWHVALDAVDALDPMTKECAAAHAREQALRAELRDEQASGKDRSQPAHHLRGREHELAQGLLDRRKRNFLREAVRAAVRHLKGRATDRFDEEIAALRAPIDEWAEILSPAGAPPIALAAANPSGRGTSPRLTYQAGEGGQHALGRCSDSQLETLGMAIRLARAEREQSGGLVVLDDPSDVLDTDTTHQLVTEGFDRLLTSGHQILVLTHDRELTRSVWARAQEFNEPVERHIVESVTLEGDRVAGFASQDLRGLMSRLHEVLDVGHGRSGPFDDWQTWRVNAAGNLLRQAIESALAEIEQVLGGIAKGTPVAWRDADSLADRWNRMHTSLTSRQNELQECGGRCLQGFTELKKLICRVADIYTLGINEASHPGVVLPSLPAVRNQWKKLKEVSGLLISDTGVYADRHLTCKAAFALRHADECLLVTEPEGSEAAA